MKNCLGDKGGEGCWQLHKAFIVKGVYVMFCLFLCNLILVVRWKSFFFLACLSVKEILNFLWFIRISFMVLKSF